MSKVNLRSRTIQLIKNINASIIPLCFIIALLESIMPYFMLSIMTIIINYSIDNFASMVSIIAGILVLKFCLENLTQILNKIYQEKLYLMEHAYKSLKTEKCVKAGFQFIEQGDYENIRQGIRFSDESMGTFTAIINSYHTFIKNCLSIAAALVVLFKMFYNIIRTDSTGRGYWITMLVLVIFFSGLSSWITCKVQKYSEGHIPDLFKRITDDNRLAMYLAEMVVFNYNLGKDIRIYRADKMISAVFEDMVKNIKPVFKKICALSGNSGMIGNILSSVITGGIYIIVGWSAIIGLIPVGNVILYSGSVNQMITAITSAVYLWGEIGVLSVRLEPAFKLFDVPNASDNRGENLFKNEKYSIRFDHVWFRYAGSEEYVLRDISFEIKKGEKVVFVGPNGAGKSTIVKLLCGLYEPSKGNIYLNERNMRDMPMEEIQQIIKAVFQDFHLFSFSIGENVAVDNNYDAERVLYSLEQAGLKERVDKMKFGLKTSLYQDFDENGVEISGGEAQKIAIARLIYADSPIAVLDEPTAALDPIAESEIYEKFSNAVDNKTTIFVSHRLSSAKLCDKIFVLDMGKVVQEGTHKELVSQKDGIYYKLWKAQVKYYQ